MTDLLSEREAGNPLDERILAAATAAAELSSEHAEFWSATLVTRPESKVIPSARSNRRRLVVTVGFVAAICVLIAVLVVALPGSPASTRATAPSGEPNKTLQSQPASNFSIDFVDQSVGYVILHPGSSRGVVEKTTNGGKQWQVVFMTSDGLNGIDFVSRSVGWALGPDDLFRTTDGGVTWQRLFRQAPDALVKIDFVNPLDGWGVTSDGGLLSTENGGSWWSDLKLPAPIDAACLSGPSEGWIAGSNFVDATTNDGVSWNRQYTESGDQQQALSTQLACSADSAAVAFNGTTTAEANWVEVADAFGGPAVAKWLPISTKLTYDSWVVAPDTYVTGIASPDSESVVLLSGCGLDCLTRHPYIGMVNNISPPQDLGYTSSMSRVTLNVPGQIVDSSVSFAGPSDDGFMSIIAVTDGTYTDYIYRSTGLAYVGASDTGSHKSVLGWDQVAAIPVS